MKKFTFVSGAISFSLIGLGLMFKILHLPYANLMQAFGILLISLLFIPLIFTFWYKQAN
jgi:energy-coupling factor transporter transmembrane protein EcfT